MKEFSIYITTQDSDEKLALHDIKDVQAETSSGVDIVSVNTKKRYQTILGFGGALTDSSAYVLSQVDTETKQLILQSYYDQARGIGYNFARIHINSCDFSLENYSYVEEGDMTLDTFSLENAEKYALPLIRDVKKINNNLKLLASPWSAPAYMKDNDNMNFGGRVKPEFKQLWADYFVKYIQAMRDKNLDIWAVTVQNEPAAKQTWDSCEYTAEEERDFIKRYLGPAFEKNNLLDKHIVIWDHNRDIVYDRAKKVLEDKDAAKYVWGTGIHWYMSENYENTTKVHNEFPDKHIIFTEGCQEGGPRKGAWFTGERYGRNIINDFNNYVEAWIDWNIVLDEKGGPNHVNNFCDAPIIIDTSEKKVHYNSSFYYIAHFSKFIKSGAARVDTFVYGDKIHALSCINPDNRLCIVIMNESCDERYIRLTLDNEKQDKLLKLIPHSIYTFVEK